MLRQRGSESGWWDSSHRRQSHRLYCCRRAFVWKASLAPSGRPSGEQINGSGGRDESAQVLSLQETLSRILRTNGVAAPRRLPRAGLRIAPDPDADRVADEGAEASAHRAAKHRSSRGSTTAFSRPSFAEPAKRVGEDRGGHGENDRANEGARAGPAAPSPEGIDRSKEDRFRPGILCEVQCVAAYASKGADPSGVRACRESYQCARVEGPHPECQRRRGCRRIGLLRGNETGYPDEQEQRCTVPHGDLRESITPFEDAVRLGQMRRHLTPSHHCIRPLSQWRPEFPEIK